MSSSIGGGIVRDLLARRVLLAGAIAVLLGGVLWFLRRDGRSAAASPTSESATVVGHVAPELPTASPTVSPNVEDTRERVAGASTASKETTTLAPEPAAPEFRLHGTVEVLDAHGVSLAPLDAELLLHAWGGYVGGTLEGEVRAGHWNPRRARPAPACCRGSITACCGSWRARHTPTRSSRRSSIGTSSRRCSASKCANASSRSTSSSLSASTAEAVATIRCARRPATRKL